MTLSEWFEDISPRARTVTTDAEPIRFALIGLGWFTVDAALPAIDALPTCRATVAVSGSADKAGDLVDGHDTLEHALTYEEFHEGAAADAYDAIYVGTPNRYHLPFVETAARHDAAVLCEKPMEATLERSRELVETAAMSDAPLMIAYRMQTDPLIERTREFILDGGIGEPKYAHGEMAQPMLSKLSPDYDQWRLDAELAGGCALIDLGIYPINTLRFLLDADPIRASGVVSSTHEAFDEVDEDVAFTLTFPDGFTAACSASQRAALSDQLRIVGTDGRIDIQPAFFGDVVVTIDRDGEQITLRNDDINQLEEEFAAFSVAANGGFTPDADGEHGLVDMITIDAIYRSAETGSAIDLTDR